MEVKAEEVRLLGETAGTVGDSDLGTFSTNVTVVGESMLRSLPRGDASLEAQNVVLFSHSLPEQIAG